MSWSLITTNLSLVIPPRVSARAAMVGVAVDYTVSTIGSLLLYKVDRVSRS